jgi:hypothetical protein
VRWDAHTTKGTTKAPAAQDSVSHAERQGISNEERLLGERGRQGSGGWHVAQTARVLRLAESVVHRL